MDYLSYSSYRLYRESPALWYARYILGVKEEPTEKMIVGSLFSEAYANRQFDYKTAIKEKKFSPKYIKMFERALSDKNLVYMPPQMCEVEIRKQIDDMTLLAKMDGYLQDELIIENKTGSKWTQERADTDNQLTFYAICAPHRLIKLQHIDISGKITVRETQRTTEQKEALLEDVKAVWKDIQKIYVLKSDKAV